MQLREDLRTLRGETMATKDAWVERREVGNDRRGRYLSQKYFSRPDLRQEKRRSKPAR